MDTKVEEEKTEGTKMKIAIATPILFDKTSPFNHLFQDIIGGFLDAGNRVIRFVACRDNDETDFKYGFTGSNIEYVKYKRKESAHNNIITRYIRDTLTSIREARGIRECDADVLFEDVSYSSFWTVRAAKKNKMKIVAMLQDVWPDNAVQSGLIKEGGILYRYFEAWQRYVYMNADKIICISDDMKDFIVSKGISEKKIEVIYNWGYSDEIVNIPWEKNEFVKKYGLSRDKFYAVYAGNIGKMQNVEIVVRAAKELEDREDIQFLIIGDGVRKETIAAMVKGMKNVTMLPMQPSELATHIYSAAGVNIIPLVAGGTKTAMPSKTGVVLSCGKPAIYTFGIKSKFARMIMAYGAGVSIETSDNKALAKMIIVMSERLDDTSEAAYQVFKMYFERRGNINKYVNIFKAVKK